MSSINYQRLCNAKSPVRGSFAAPSYFSQRTPTYHFNTHFNIILSATPKSSESLPFSMSNENCVHLWSSACMLPVFFMSYSIPGVSNLACQRAAALTVCSLAGRTSQNHKCYTQAHTVLCNPYSTHVIYKCGQARGPQYDNHAGAAQ